MSYGVKQYLNHVTLLGTIRLMSDDFVSHVSDDFVQNVSPKTLVADLMPFHPLVVDLWSYRHIVHTLCQFRIL